MNEALAREKGSDSVAKDTKEETIKNNEAAFKDDMNGFIGEDELITKQASKKRTKKTYEEMSYEEIISLHRRTVRLRVLSVVLVAAILAAAFITGRYFVMYSSYEVIETETRSSGASVQYTEFYGKTLRYTKDGAMFYSNRENPIWNDTYEMSNPTVDVCNRYAVIADLYGTSACLFDLEGKLTSIEVQKQIQKVQVSEKGSVALLLQDGTEHILQYYNSEGTLLAEGKLTFEKSGYPIDMSLSDDGLKLVISYVTVEGGTTGANVAFYNFSDIGESQIDNVVSMQAYEDTIISTVYYADDDTVFAFGDAGLVLFKGSQKPEAAAQISVTEEIQSIFYSEKYAGMVFTDGDGYRADIYDVDGQLVYSLSFDFDYTNIKLSGNLMILYNNKEWCIYTLDGRQKLSPCELDASVTDIVALSSTKFLLVKANKTQTVKLKL